MSLEVDGRRVATARFCEHAAADDQGAWIVSDCPRRLFSRNRAIAGLTVAEMTAAEYSNNDPCVVALRSELL